MAGEGKNPSKEIWISEIYVWLGVGGGGGGENMYHKLAGFSCCDTVLFVTHLLKQGCHADI